MKYKAGIGFFLLFCTYHLSELVGTNMVLVPLAFLLFFVIAQYTAKWQGRKNFLTFGFHHHSGAKLNLLLGYLCGFLFYSGAMLISYARGEIVFSGLFEVRQMILPVVGIILLTLLSSTSEDLLTRGYVFTWISNRVSPVWLVILTSLVYTLNHIWRIENSYTQWILLFGMGLVFAIPYIYTHSLWFTVGCHWGWNTVSLFKSQIGGMTDLSIIDSTTDWTYIVTVAIQLIFISMIARWLPRREAQLSTLKGEGIHDHLYRVITRD